MPGPGTVAVVTASQCMSTKKYLRASAQSAPSKPTEGYLYGKSCAKNWGAVRQIAALTFLSARCLYASV